MRAPPSPLVDDGRASSAPRPLTGASWRWAPELALVLAALWCADVLLAPGLAVIDASPSLLWLPVLAFGAVYGKGPGLIAALAASAIVVVRGDPGVVPGQDFYELMLDTARSPVLWILAALGIGDMRDRWSERQEELQASVRHLQVQRAAIADYATALRSHIDTLEFALATADESASISLPQSLEALANNPAPMPALRTAASLMLGCDAVQLWWFEDDRPAHAAAGDGTPLPPAGLRERLGFRQGPIIMPLDLSPESGAGGVGIAAPIRQPPFHDLVGAVLFQSWSDDLEPDAALAFADLIARRLVPSNEAAVSSEGGQADTFERSANWIGRAEGGR